MIPTIGILIAAYVFVRALDLIGAAQTRYQSRTWCSIMPPICALLLLLAAVSATEVVINAAQVGRLPEILR